MKALVALAPGELSVEEVVLEAPRAGEVRVRMKAAGVCHSDLSVANGAVPMPLPMVLGHEGAGVIDAVGPGVANVTAGDHVVLSFVPACGECYFCVRQEPHLCVKCDAQGRMMDGSSRLHWQGRDLGAMSQLGCLAEFAVVPAISVQRIDRSIPLDRAALVGCGVMTGIGAVTKTARVRPGSSVAVFGCGGVGLAAVQGARLAGARQIIAVDLHEGKLALAGRFGATHTIKATGDSVAEVLSLTAGIGVDHSFEMSGNPKVMQQAYAAARRGGTVCVVGLGRFDQSIQFNACAFAPEAKTVKGCFYGSANFRADMPDLLALYRGGRLDLDGLITSTYRIDDAPRAFEDLALGRNARGIVLFD